MRRFGVCATLLLATAGLVACADGEDRDAPTTTATEATVAPGPAGTAEVPDDDPSAD